MAPVRVHGLSEVDRLLAEELLETAVIAALEAVAEQVAGRIGQVQTAGGTIAFHLPGKHDQSTHGKGGGTGAPGSGRDMSRDHETLGAIYHDSVGEDGGWIQSADGDLALIGIAKEQGFDAKPTVMSSDDFDQAVAEGGHSVMYRGINPDSDWRGGREPQSGAEVHTQTRDGDYHPGYGVFGNGYYMATDRAKAESFSDGAPGSVGRYALHKDAKTVTFEDLRSEYGRYFDSQYKTDPMETKGMTTDYGRFAASRGYDAIHVPVGTKMTGGGGGGTVQREDWVILNRGALIADSGEA